MMASSGGAIPLRGFGPWPAGSLPDRRQSPHLTPFAVHLMAREIITLVGRASQLAFREFESGATMASFTLTIKPRGEQPPLVVQCEGYGMKIAEQFELMDEGSLVGIIGILTKGAVGALPLVRIDRLEYLGRPLEVARG